MKIFRKLNYFALSNPLANVIHSIHTPSLMKCLALKGYGKTLDAIEYDSSIRCPTERDLLPDEALVKVHAASVNPFDIEMSRGYGRNAINVFRKLSKRDEFPLILGRDCSGTIVSRGKRFRRFKEGDSVSCVRWISGHGTHAEYVVVNKTEMSLKPKNLNFIEAASLPYVGCTAWNALVNSGAVPVKGRSKRIFIPGGSGGIGSFATQLCQVMGHEIVTTCSPDAVNALQKLGIQNIIDHTSDSYIQDLESAGPFDVILDALNEKYIEIFQKLLRQNSSSRYVSLRPTLLPDTDNHGVMLGTLRAGGKYITSTLNQLSSGKGAYNWGFFNPNALILDQIKPYIENDQIKPFVDKVFSSDDILMAYQYVEDGHARGKTIIKMTA